jgi:uncharacterized protein DUF4352
MRVIRVIAGAALMASLAAAIVGARVAEVRLGAARAPVAATQAPPTATAAPAPPTPIPPPHVSSPDAPGVVVIASAFRADSGGDTPPPPGQRYVATRVTVANRGSDAYDVDPLAFSVVDHGDGVTHLAEPMDQGIAATALRATTLEPSRSVTGDVAFAVPVTETSAALYWEPTPMSPAVLVPLGK